MKYSLEGISEAAQYVIDTCGKDTIWVFDGEMGAGKTTLTKEICRLLKVEDVISSPTFSIVNEYYSNTNGTIYHFDFYRIEEETEAVEIGVEEYFYSGNLCLIEWASRVSSLIPDQFVHIQLEIEGPTERKLVIDKYGQANN